MKIKTEKLGSLVVQTRKGNWVVRNRHGEYLIAAIDSWGKNKPEFAHSDFAIRFTEKQAREQVCFCRWSGNKVETEAVKMTENKVV